MWTNQSVTCVTTERVTHGTSVQMMWQGRTIVRHIADMVGTVAGHWENAWEDNWMNENLTTDMFG
jgi:hypothetical protein